MSKNDFEKFINIVIRELGKRIEVWVKAKEDKDEDMCVKMKYEVKLNLWYLDILKDSIFRSRDLYRIIIDEVKSDFWGVFEGRKSVDVLSEGVIHIEDYVEKKEEFFEERGAEVIEFDKPEYKENE